MVKDVVERAIEVYNRYRYPEAKATLIKINGSYVEVLFEGSFCRTCGVNDWVEDFRYVLEDLGVEAELKEIREPEDQFSEWRIGVFEIRRVNKLLGIDKGVR